MSQQQQYPAITLGRWVGRTDQSLPPTAKIEGADAPLPRGYPAMTYTAASIRILDTAEINARFGWTRVAALAERYHRPTAWIARGLEACRRAGVNEDYFVARYLRREPIPCHAGVDAAMRELLTEARGA